MESRVHLHAQQPAGRAFPTDAATSPPNHTLKSRRRTSLPSTDGRPSKRAPNYVRTQAASPQVISSLIDQLSAISIPAHNHFENLLVGYDHGPPTSASPSIRTHSGRNSLAGHDGSSVDQAAYYNSIREQNDLYPDDACEPPVIRTAKPPSGLSPLTAPKKRDKPHSLSSYIGRSGGSSCSLQSTHSNRSASSFGNISIEAPAPKQTSGGSNRSSAESKRSAKGHRSLMYMSSRERLRQKETERKRVTVHSLDDIPSQDSPRKTAAQLFPYEDTIKEEPIVKEEQEVPETEITKFGQKYPSRNSSPRRLRINLVDGPQGESPSEKGLIPDRLSSLRHTGSPSRKAKKSNSTKGRQSRSFEMESAPEDDTKTDQESALKEKILKELEQEENEVAQRIRVLKEQKLRRDILAGKMPVDVDAGAMPPHVPRVSSIPSPEPSPTSTVSSASEKRVQDSTKAHRVLGITGDPSLAETPLQRPTEENDPGEAEPPPILQTRSTRHSRHRSLTVNDGDDLTSLPINYALALQRLEESAPLSPVREPPQAKSPPPPSISIASTKNTHSSSDSNTTRRASQTAVGGRSAVGRRAATSSTIMGASGGHKHSSSVTDVNLSKLSSSPRSVSEDVVSRHKSMHVSSLQVSNSMQLQRRRTLTKKRWSHPDLPAKAEKAHNEKVDRSEAKVAAGAVQSPPRSIVEERPASLDSIDIDVQGYLNSSRLSQKIRHPQSGRIISFSEVGDPQGFAVFVCVGMGLTRYVMAFYDQLATTLKLRLITPDRPGIGGSQVDSNGTPLSWPGKRDLQFVLK